MGQLSTAWDRREDRIHVSSLFVFFTMCQKKMKRHVCVWMQQQREMHCEHMAVSQCESWLNMVIIIIIVCWRSSVFAGLVLYVNLVTMTEPIGFPSSFSKKKNHHHGVTCHKSYSMVLSMLTVVGVSVSWLVHNYYCEDLPWNLVKTRHHLQTSDDKILPC